MSGEMMVKTMLELSRNGQKQNSLEFAIVESLEPLKLKIDQKKTLTNDFVILSQFVKEKRSVTNNEIILWEGMQIGDKVSMISFNDSQTYYVLEVVQ